MTSRPRLTHALAAAGLGAAILLAYASSFDAGLVYDNAFIIRRAARVHAATWANVVEIFTTDYWWPFNVHDHYRPLATLSYLFNWAVLGNAGRPAGYHWINLALHWGNALLVYALARRALGLGGVTAFLVALLFATHPVATEAVTNVIGRADLMAGAAVFGGLLLYVQATRAPTGAARGRWLAAVAVTAFLGLLSKESAVVLVGAVVVYDFVFELPVTEHEGWRDRAALVLRIARARWIALAPPLLAIWLIRWRLYRATPPWTIGVGSNPIAGADPWTAYLTAFKALGRAFWILLWPARLCPDYSLDEVALVRWPLAGWQDGQAVLAFLGCLIAIAMVLVLRRRHPPASFFLGFFLVALLPGSNLLFLSTTILADRLLYIPLAGFSGCVVLGVEAVAMRAAGLVGGARPPSRRAVSTVASVAIALVACAYVARTARRNLDWRDEVTLWSAAVASCPGSYRSHELLGAALLNPLDPSDRAIGEIDRVIALQERAVGIVESAAPGDASMPPTILERLAFLYFRKAQLAERAAPSPALAAEASAAWGAKAADAFERAAAGFAAERELRRRIHGPRADAAPDLAGPLLFDSFGIALLRAGRPDRAIDAFAKARERAPWEANLHEHLGTAYQRSGRSEDALLSLLEAVAVDPSRNDLKRAVLAVDAQLRPGQCGFSLDGEQLVFAGDCPEAHRNACVAYTRLVAALDAARKPETERVAEIARRVRAVTENLRCSETISRREPTPDDGAATDLAQRARA